MVKLEEEIESGTDILSNHSDDYTDTSESNSGDESEDDLFLNESESLWDRIIALQHMIPFKQRRMLSHSIHNITSFSTSAVSFAGNTFWAVTSSILLLGFPLLHAYEDEHKLVEMEKEFKLQQNEMLTPSSKEVDLQ